ncbi:MAG: ATPase [Alphaproteobacteria bacterium]|nr:ATPase [Alphaproteobacteria bacterium]
MSDYSVFQDQSGYVVERKGKILKTPGGNDYRLPSAALAEAVADEWRNAGDIKKLNPRLMPLTQFAATSIDVVPKDRAKIINQITAYAGSELLCHRASHPKDLVILQHKKWQPLLDWCEKRFGAKLIASEGIMPMLQKKEALSALHAVVDSYDNFRLMGLQSAVSVAGSLVLGLALAEKHKSADDVFHTSELDIEYQTERWGEDAEIATTRAGVLRELTACERWFSLL